MLLFWNLIVVFSIPSVERVPKLAVFYESTTSSLDGVLMLTKSQDKLIWQPKKIAEIEAQMGILIDKAQGAFIKDRSIIDNEPVCQGLVRCCHKDGGAPICLMKLNICKVYDTLDLRLVRLF